MPRSIRLRVICMNCEKVHDGEYPHERFLGSRLPVLSWRAYLANMERRWTSPKTPVTALR